MTGDQEKISSPSRTYVAICNKTNFDGHYFRKFTLPTQEEVRKNFKHFNDHVRSVLLADRNDAAFASWYFLNMLDLSACIEGVVSWENFQDVKDVEEIKRNLEFTLLKLSWNELCHELGIPEHSCIGEVKKTISYLIQEAKDYKPTTRR